MKIAQFASYTGIVLLWQTLVQHSIPTAFIVVLYSPLYLFVLYPLTYN